MSRRVARVYVGNISSRTKERDLDRAFEKFGRVNRIDLKNGFGFVEFDDARDAEDAVKDMDSYDLDGRKLVVELARGSRAPRKPFAGGRGGYRVLVEGLDARTSWQDLKDFARKVGNVNYTDVWMDRGKKFGVIEYLDKEDFREALRTLDDQKLDGVRVHVTEDKGNSGSGGGGGGDRRSRSRSRSPRRRSASRSPERARDRSRDRDPPRERERAPYPDDPVPAAAAVEERAEPRHDDDRARDDDRRD